MKFTHHILRVGLAATMGLLIIFHVGCVSPEQRAQQKAQAQAAAEQQQAQQLAAVERFKIGWPTLVKGMSAVQVENAIGTFPNDPAYNIHAASVDSMRKDMVVSLTGAVHPYAAYKLEFDSSGLSSWKLFPRSR